MTKFEEFNSFFPDSRYREIGAFYDGNDHNIYQQSKAPINNKILTYDEIKDTKNRIGWIIPKDLIAVDLDNKVEAAKLYNILTYYSIKCTWTIGKHGGHFIFRNPDNYNQGTKLATSIGLSIDTRCQEKGYIILPVNDPNRKWGVLTNDLDDLPYYLKPLKDLKLTTDLIDLNEGSRNDALLKHFLNLKDYAKELTTQEKIDSIRIINRFIIKEPIPEGELNSTVLRDSMVEKVKDAEEKTTKNPKRSIKLEDIACKFVSDNRCITINNEVYTYNGKYYKYLPAQELERVLHEEYDRNLIESDRLEVIKFIKLKTYVATNMVNKNYNEIVFKNGILNLSDMKLRPHTPLLYNTIYIDYNWNEKPSYSPIIDSFMNQISNGDELTKQALYEIVGYTMLQKPIFAKMFVLLGGGGTGKSTFLNIIKKLVGEEYCSYLSLSDMENRFMPAELFGKLVNLGDDIDAKIFKDTGMLKSMISGETVMVEHKHQAPFHFNNFAKLIFTCNKLPQVADKTGGFLRRCVIIEINKKIETFDPFFMFKIENDDMEYLLYNSIIALLKALERNALTTTKNMEDMLNDFRINMSSVSICCSELGFTSENILYAPVNTSYELYSDYCDRSGFKKVNKLNFSQEVCELYSLKVMNTTKGGREQCRRFVPVDG